MKNLENKVAVITGGNSGIGLSTAILFAEHGAKVAIAGRSKASLESAADMRLIIKRLSEFQWRQVGFGLK